MEYASGVQGTKNRRNRRNGRENTSSHVVSHERAAAKTSDNNLLHDWVVDDLGVDVGRVPRQSTRKVPRRGSVGLGRAKSIADYLVRSIPVESRTDRVEYMLWHDILYNRNARAQEGPADTMQFGAVLDLASRILLGRHRLHRRRQT